MSENHSAPPTCSSTAGFPTPAGLSGAYIPATFLFPTSKCRCRFSNSGWQCAVSASRYSFFAQSFLFFVSIELILAAFAGHTILSVEAFRSWASRSPTASLILAKHIIWPIFITFPSQPMTVAVFLSFACFAFQCGPLCLAVSRSANIARKLGLRFGIPSPEIPWCLLVDPSRQQLDFSCSEPPSPTSAFSKIRPHHHRGRKLGASWDSGNRAWEWFQLRKSR